MDDLCFWKLLCHRCLHPAPCPHAGRLIDIAEPERWLIFPLRAGPLSSLRWSGWKEGGGRGHGVFAVDAPPLFTSFP